MGIEKTSARDGSGELHANVFGLPRRLQDYESARGVARKDPAFWPPLHPPAGGAAHVDPERACFRLPLAANLPRAGRRRWTCWTFSFRAWTAGGREAAVMVAAASCASTDPRRRSVGASVQKGNVPTGQFRDPRFAFSPLLANRWSFTLRADRAIGTTASTAILLQVAHCTAHRSSDDGFCPASSRIPTTVTSISNSSTPTWRAGRTEERSLCSLHALWRRAYGG